MEKEIKDFNTNKTPITAWTNFRCFIGLHRLEVIRENDITSDNVLRPIVGKAIISRCFCCGKVKVKYVHLNNNL